MKFSGFQKVIALIILGVLLGVVTFQFLVNPWHQTFKHGEEMAQTIQRFREIEFALNTRLQPELILSVATDDYLPTFLEINKVGMCERCDRFWVTTSIEIKRIRVVEYSPTISRVRAEVAEYGYRINSRSYERITPHDVARMDIVTYVFIRQDPDSPWLLDDIQNYKSPNHINPNAVTLDDFLLFDIERVDKNNK
jgi:hypothetical protein